MFNSNINTYHNVYINRVAMHHNNHNVHGYVTVLAYEISDLQKKHEFCWLFYYRLFVVISIIEPLIFYGVGGLFFWKSYYFKPEKNKNRIGHNSFNSKHI